MPLLNPVSSQTKLGDSDYSRVYQGSDLVYENAHNAISGNAVSNPFFDSDAKYPGAIGLGFAQELWAGWASSSLGYPANWGYHSPLFTNPYDYKSYLPNYFLYRYNTLGKGLGSYANDEHVDLAKTVSSIGNLTAQKRILKLHGAGNRLMTGNTSTANRSYPSPPITSCHNDGITIGSSFSTNLSHRWCMHSYVAEVAIPSNATGATFGAYVKCPSDDHFKMLNGGVVALILPEYASNHACSTRVHTMIFRKQSSTGSFDLVEGDNTAGNGTAHFNWSGLTDSHNFATRGAHRWNDYTYISAHQYEDSEDYHEFKKASRTVTNASGNALKNPIFGNALQYGHALLVLGFLENHSYLGQYNSGPTGAIQFYNPFVTFTT
tara:strand:+ start:110 stop:1243 length:1134 start_codon:yes stop_codon:yes gene_type:complete